jgi:hypothetical protein
MKRFSTEDVAEAPEEVWLVECQRCFLQRIIYPSDRVLAKRMTLSVASNAVDGR